MLGGAPVDSIAIRQHLTAPDAHAAELNAAGTVSQKVAVPLRGLLQELRVLQLQATPVFCDSLSTVFVANDAASVRRSVWLQRRAAVLRELKDIDEINFIKISERDNVSDGHTKPITRDRYQFHLRYTHPYSAALKKKIG